MYLFNMLFTENVTMTSGLHSILTYLCLSIHPQCLDYTFPQCLGNTFELALKALPS